MERDTSNECFRDDEIDLYDLWLTLKKRRITILLITLISVGTAFAYAALAPKVYRVTNTLVLNQMQDEGQMQDKGQMQDEGELIKQGEIIAAVADLDKLLALPKDEAVDLLGMQVKDLNNIGKIKASEIKGSSALRVDIETTVSRSGIALMEALPGYIQSTPTIANRLDMQKALMEKNSEDLKAIIDNPMRDLKLSPNTVVYVPSIDLYTLREKYNRLNMMIEKMDKGRIVSLSRKTEPPVKPYKPKRLMSVLIGLVMGCFLGIVVAVFMEWSSNARRARCLE